MKNNKLLIKIFAIALLFLAPTAVFAVEVPAVLVKFVDIITVLLTDYLAVLAIVVILMIGAYQSTEVGNARPFKWALFGAIGLGAAAYFGESILDYARDVFNLTGTDAVVDSEA